MNPKPPQRNSRQELQPEAGAVLARACDFSIVGVQGVLVITVRGHPPGALWFRAYGFLALSGIYKYFK